MRFTPCVGVLLLIRAWYCPVARHAQTEYRDTNAHPFCAYFYKKEVCCKFMELIHIIFIVIGVLAGLTAGFVIGMVYRKKVAEREIGSAEMEATRLINEAIRSGENRKKEMLMEAKDEIHKSRT